MAGISEGHVFAGPARSSLPGKLQQPDVGHLSLSGQEGFATSKDPKHHGTTVMKYHLSRTGRRAIAVMAGTAVAALAITSAAVAATSSGASPGSGAARAAAAIRKCAAALGQSGNVSVWVADGQGSGAAGTIYYPLEFTNLSGHTCSMYGFPGVSAISRSGQQLGSPATWESGGSFGTPRTVIVAPGATVHTILAYHDVVVSTSPGCDPVTTTFELRVYPPDQSGAAFAFFGLQACSHAGPAYLSVGPIKPGVGTING
jgi:Protein of unknown function (DUF4232)